MDYLSLNYLKHLIKILESNLKKEKDIKEIVKKGKTLEQLMEAKMIIDTSYDLENLEDLKNYHAYIQKLIKVNKKLSE